MQPLHLDARDRRGVLHTPGHPKNGVGGGSGRIGYPLGDAPTGVMSIMQGTAERPYLNRIEASQRSSSTSTGS
jgi:hypothetical protein